jgi:tRNA(adenine34) deaminase
MLIRDDEEGMHAALREARASAEADEVPVGCVIVHDGVIIGRGHNQVEGLRDATAHAEILAIGAASNALESWRLGDCTLYVTLEPCAMCAGAIYWSGIGRVVFALSSATFQGKIDPESAAGLALSCREVFARGGRAVEVSGPHLEDLAWEVHAGFWQPGA